MIRTLRLVALSLCAATALFPRSSVEREVHAGTALAMRMSDLVDRSNAILEGRVVDKRAFRATSGRIETEYRISVARSFLGTPGETFTFRAPGGVLPDGRGMMIAGLPELRHGEDVLVFLSSENAHGARVPVGLAQGKFRVVTDAHGVKRMLRDQSGLDLVDASGAPVRAPDTLASSDYETMAMEIEALVRTRDERARAAAAGKGR